MGLDHNPNFPEQLGMQRIDVGYGSNPITTQQQWQAIEFEALHTGQVDYLEFFGNGTTSELGDEHLNQERPLMVDLYDDTIDGDPIYDVFLTQILPSAVTGSSAIVNENLTTPLTLSRILTVGDGLFAAAASFGHHIRIQFDTATFPLDRRVLGVRLLVRGNANTELIRSDPGNILTWRKTRSLGSGGGTWQNWFPLLTEPFADTTHTPDWTWWTPQMIRDLRTYASGGTRAFYVKCLGFGWRIDCVRLQVIWTPETRVGAGIAPPVAGLAWTPIPIETPAATGGAVSLTSGNVYTAVLRQPWRDTEFDVSTATLAWRDMQGSPPVTGWGNRAIPVATETITGGTITPPTAPVPQPSTADFKEAMVCMQCVTGSPSSAGGTVLETAMPYTLNRGVEVRNEQQVGSTLYDEKTVEQTLTVSGAAASVTYGQTSVVVGWNPSKPPAVDATISCEVWTATGAPEVRVFSPVARTYNDISRVPIIADFPIGESNREYRVIRFRHEESEVLPAGQYEIRFTADGLTNDTSWYISAFIAEAHTVDQTFGRAVDEATGEWLSGNTSNQLSDADWSSDLATALMEVPPAVTGVVAYIGVTTAHHAEVCTGETCATPGCADTASPFTELRWEMTEDEDSFLYEIQRSDPVDPTFRTVMAVIGREVTSWVDHEGRIGLTSQYRIRSVRADNITGDWSDPVTSTLPGDQIALCFTSNAATGLAVVYPEIYDRATVVREWEFQEYDDVVLQPIYGRERQVAFFPIERKGIRFERTILLNALCTTALPTMDLFTPLRRLSWAPIPYVCVRDGEGNRWFANVRVPTGINERPAEFWFANIVVTEVADKPIPGRTDTPQVTVESLGDVVL